MTEPDLWMKGLGRVLSWVGQDLPSQSAGEQESQRETDLADLATRLLSQGGLNAHDEATLELVRGTIQSARLERGIADQSAAALRLELKSIQEELVGARTEFNQVNHAKDEAESLLRNTRDQLEKRELALSTAKKAAQTQQDLIDEHELSLKTLRGDLNKSKANEKDTRGELSTTVEAQRNVNDDLVEKLQENDLLRKEVEDAKTQLQAGEIAFSSAQVELNRDLEDARDMRENAETGFHEAEKRANRAEERANRAEEQVLRAKERAARAEEVSRHLEEVAAHSRRRAEEGQASQVELENQLAKAEEAIHGGEEQLLIVRGRLEELNAGLLGDEASIEDLEGVINSLGYEGEDASALSEEPESTRRMLRGLLNRLQSELELSGQLRDQLESKTNRLDSEESLYRHRVAEFEAHRTRSESEIRETRHLLEEAERTADEVGSEHVRWQSRAQIAEDALKTSEARAQEAEERAAKAVATSAAVDEWEELARSAEQRAHVAEEKNVALEIQKTHLREQQDRAEARASVAEETAIRSAMEAERAAGAGEKALEALSRYEERCRRADQRADEAHQASRAATAKKAAAEVLAAQARQQAETAEQQLRALQRDATERSQRLESLEASLALRLAEVAAAKKETAGAEHKKELTQKQLNKLQEDFTQKEAALIAAEARELSTEEASHLAVEAARAEMRAKLEKELAKKEQVLQEIRRELADKERSVAEQLAEADGKVALIEQARNEEIRKLRTAGEQRDQRQAEDVERLRAELSTLRGDHDKLLSQVKAGAAREALAEEMVHEAERALEKSEKERSMAQLALSGMDERERERANEDKVQKLRQAELALAAETRIEDAERRTASLQEMVGQREAMLAESRQDLSASQQELSASQQELSASQQELSASQQELSASRQELSASRQELSDSRQELSDSQRELSDSQQELSNSRQELNDSQQEFALSQKELDETWSANEELRGQVTRLERGLEAAAEQARLSDRERAAAQELTPSAPAAEDVLSRQQDDSKLPVSSSGVYSRDFRPQATQAVGMSPSVDTPSEALATEAPYRDHEGEWDDAAGVSIEIEATGDGSRPDVPGLDDLLEELDNPDTGFDNSDGKIYSAKREEEDGDTAFSFFRRKK